MPSYAISISVCASSVPASVTVPSPPLFSILVAVPPANSEPSLSDLETAAGTRDSSTPYSGAPASAFQGSGSPSAPEASYSEPKPMPVPTAAAPARRPPASIAAMRCAVVAPALNPPPPSIDGTREAAAATLVPANAGANADPPTIVAAISGACLDIW